MSIISRLRKPNLSKRIWEKILSRVSYKQWILLVAKSAENGLPTWNNFTPLTPPADRIWADPFPWLHNGLYFIFYEERFYSADRGHISCFTMDTQMRPIENTVVLQRPYHLSYPFIFTYQEQIYMIPETEQNHTVELYRCTHFPNQWEFVKILLPDIRAVDATLLEFNGKWWMFANLRERGSTWETLCLFYAESPLSEQWTPHPRNPIVEDIRSARPAGRIFVHNGRLIRPSQDCSVRYGYAINFNSISVLNESDYAENREWYLPPPENTNILATHTWNQTNQLTVIDALIRQRK